MPNWLSPPSGQDVSKTLLRRFRGGRCFYIVCFFSLKDGGVGAHVDSSGLGRLPEVIVAQRKCISCELEGRFPSFFSAATGSVADGLAARPGLRRYSPQVSTWVLVLVYVCVYRDDHFSQAPIPSE